MCLIYQEKLIVNNFFMIISRTPYRLSLFGGGTDYPSYYRKYTGEVISTTINKYVFVTCRYLPNFFKENIRVSYSKIETVNNIHDIKHPSVLSVLKFLNIKKNIEIHYDGDLPGKSGLGSSSAFTVGLLNAAYCYKNKKINKNKFDLGLKAIHVEQNLNKEKVGSQDQTAVAVGGFNNIHFKRNGIIQIKKINLKNDFKKKLNRNFLLFSTGKFRTANKITKTYVHKLSKKENFFEEIKQITLEAKKIMLSNNKNINDLGKLMHESWKLKKSLSNKISNSFIDDLYDVGIKAGATGGKLLGAGGGGFLLFYVPGSKNKIKKSLKNLIHVPFKFENEGTKIIYK